MPTQRNDRVKVELRVQKSLMGYRHGVPSEFYVAIVGSGILLGNNTTRLAPRCTRVSNNIWTKIIWLPKESPVTFKFLIVHASTNCTAEIETIPARKIYIGQEAAVAESRFNTAGVMDGHGFQVLQEKTQYTEIGSQHTLENMLEKKIGRTEAGGGIVETKEDNTTRKDLEAEKTDESTVLANIARLINGINEADKMRYMEMIDEHVRIQELDSGRSGYRKVMLAVHASSLANMHLGFADLIHALAKIGLTRCNPRPSLCCTRGGFYEQEIWLPSRTDRFLVEKKETNLNLDDSEHMPTKAPEIGSHSTSILGLNTKYEITEEGEKSCHTPSSWFSWGRKRTAPVVAGVTGVALVCAGLYMIVPQNCKMN